MPGEHPRLNLNRPGREIEIGNECFALREFSSVDCLRAQYPAIMQEAYTLYQCLALNSPTTFSYKGIALLPLMQRHITTAFVQALTQTAYTQSFFQKQRPAQLISSSKSTTCVLDLAAQRSGSETKIIGPATTLREQLEMPRHLMENVLRSLYYLPRLAPLLNQHRQISPPKFHQRRLLFHPYYRNHLPTFLPLIRKLQASGKYDLLVSGADTNTLRRGDVDPTPLQSLTIPYLPFETAISRSQLLSSMAHAIWLTAKLGWQYRQIQNWRLLPIDVATRDVVQPLVVDLIETRLPKILLYIDMAENLYQQLQPDLVIVADEALPLLGRIALHTAQQQRIPTLTIQHGLLLNDPAYYGPTLADRFALWGEAAYTFLQAHGGTPEKLICVGATRFQQTSQELKSLELTYTLGLPPQTKIVLFLSQPAGHDISAEANLATVRSLATTISQLPDYHLLIKPHPAQSTSEINAWRSIIEQMPATIQSDLPLHAAILGADLSVTVFSTAGLEVLWLDRPLLTINLTDRPDLIPYAASGAAVAAYSAEEVLPALQQALDPADQQRRAPARRQFVEEHLGVQDDRALDRLVALIEQMVQV